MLRYTCKYWNANLLRNICAMEHAFVHVMLCQSIIYKRNASHFVLWYFANCGGVPSLIIKWNIPLANSCSCCSRFYSWIQTMFFFHWWNKTVTKPHLNKYMFSTCIKMDTKIIHFAITVTPESNFLTDNKLHGPLVIWTKLLNLYKQCIKGVNSMSLL